jgi:hypothetical protein
VDLRTQLRRLRLLANNNDHVRLTATSAHPDVPVDELLRQYQRQGYLDKQKTGEAGGGSKGAPVRLCVRVPRL